MKRVFISLLVLAMASTAGAKTQILIDGEKDIDFEASTHFSLGIWTDTAIEMNQGYSVVMVIPTSLFDTAIDYTSGVVVSPAPPGVYLEHSMSAAETGLPLPAGWDGIMGYIFPTQVVPPISAGRIIFDDIDLNIPNWPLDVPIHLYEIDGETLTLVDTVVVWGIPEPMTFGLLALGALFLRKRKD